MLSPALDTKHETPSCKSCHGHMIFPTEKSYLCRNLTSLSKFISTYRKAYAKRPKKGTGMLYVSSLIPYIPSAGRQRNTTVTGAGRGFLKISSPFFSKQSNRSALLLCKPSSEQRVASLRVHSGP